MLKEPKLIKCPNPKCGREIGELIVINDMSTRPIKRYYGCPHCFFEVDVISAHYLRKESMRVHAKEEIKLKGEKDGRKVKLDVKAEKEEEETGELEPTPPTHPSLKKIQDVLSAEPQKKEEEPPTKLEEKEEKGPSGCPHHFGYLSSRPKDAPISQECLTCPKVLDCTLKRKGS